MVFSQRFVNWYEEYYNKVGKCHSFLKKLWININNFFFNLIGMLNYFVRQILSKWNVFILITSYLFISISSNGAFIPPYGSGVRNYNFYSLRTLASLLNWAISISHWKTYVSCYVCIWFVWMSSFKYCLFFRVSLLRKIY